MSDVRVRALCGALAIFTPLGCHRAPSVSVRAEPPSAPIPTPTAMPIPAPTAARSGAGTAGCAKQVAGGDSVRRISVQGSTRSYLLSVPASYQRSQPSALNFVYHGRGGDHTSLMPLGLQRDTLTVFVDGLVQPDGSTGWNESSSSNDVAMFDAMLSSLSAELCLDPTRVHAIGFSWGGWMANALGCVRGDRLGGVASIAGGIQQRASECKGPIPAWILHFQGDPAEPFASGQKVAAFFATLAGAKLTKPDDQAHACTRSIGSASVVFCAPPGSEHAVPDWAVTSIRNFFAETSAPPSQAAVPAPALPAAFSAALGGLLLALGRRRQKRA